MDYDAQQKANQEVFAQVVKDTRPDLYGLMQILDDTKINWAIAWKVIYHLNQVAQTTKYGKVIVEIENNTVRFVRGETASKMNESLIVGPDTIIGQSSE